jgi:hypothetical protein
MGARAIRRGSAFALAVLAAFGFVLEAPVSVERLLTGGKHKVGATIDALQRPVPVFHVWFPLRTGQACSGRNQQKLHSMSEASVSGPRVGLIRFVSGFLAIALAGQGSLDSLLLSRFQVERMPLDFLDDIFLLNLALKSAKCVL